MISERFALDVPRTSIHYLEPTESRPARRITVVRDDLLAGGTKEAALESVLPQLGGEEFVYAGPRHGYAQIALAAVCQRLGKKATIFVSKSNVWHCRTQTAIDYGANVIAVPFGYLNVLKSRARVYCRESGAVLMPFGLDCDAMKMAIRDRAVLTGLEPAEVWSVAGSGTLQRGLQLAWPQARFHAVQIGRTPRAGRAVVHLAPERYQDVASVLPPFPSCDNYDAKAWRFIVEHASDGAVFWNVAG